MKISGNRPGLKLCCDVAMVLAYECVAYDGAGDRTPHKIRVIALKPLDSVHLRFSETSQIAQFIFKSFSVSSNKTGQFQILS